MIPREILEAILIFSMLGTFIMLTMLFYPYIKKWVYPSLKNKTYPSLENKFKNIKDKTSSLKDTPINKKFLNLDLINKKTKDKNDFSIVSNHQNKKSNKSSNKDLIDNKYHGLNNENEKKEHKIWNKDINLNKDDHLNKNIESNEKEDGLNKLDINKGNYDFVAKSWNEPMMKNHKEIVDNFKDGEQSDEYKNPESERSEPEISFLNNNNNVLNEGLNNHLDSENLRPENNLNNENLRANNNLSTDSLKAKPIPNSPIDAKNLSHSHDNNLGRISIGKHVIFNYNNESYLSEILEIKHENIKVLYRGNYKWIQLSNVKKIL